MCTTENKQQHRAMNPFGRFSMKLTVVFFLLIGLLPFFYRSKEPTKRELTLRAQETVDTVFQDMFRRFKLLYPNVPNVFWQEFKEKHDTEVVKGVLSVREKQSTELSEDTRYRTGYDLGHDLFKELALLLIEDLRKAGYQPIPSATNDTTGKKEVQKE